MGESTFIDGVVFRKTVAHKKMMYDKNDFNPKILLLSGGIDFQRMDTKLSSLETLFEQESKYMEILVEKIMSLKPGSFLASKFNLPSPSKKKKLPCRIFHGSPSFTNASLPEFKSKHHLHHQLYQTIGSF